jgi:serine/threonine-protein kinase Chk1
MLGAGQYGNVWLFEDKKSGKEVAVKIMEKQVMTENEMDTIKDEIGILATFDHDNIVKHIESYEDRNYIYIIMEYIAGSVELE